MWDEGSLMKKTVIRNNAFKILLSVIWCLFIGMLIAHYRDELVITVETLDPFYVIVLSVIIGIVFFGPFIALCLHQFCFDTNWKGTITNKTYETEFFAKNPTNRYSEIGQREVITIKITKTNGMKKHIVFKNNRDGIDQYYKIGDNVEHYRGAKYVLNTDNRTQEKMCVFCGTLNSITEDVCSECKKTLLE
jgi:hypothetical protein